MGSFRKKQVKQVKNGNNGMDCLYTRYKRNIEQRKYS